MYVFLLLLYIWMYVGRKEKQIFLLRLMVKSYYTKTKVKRVIQSINTCKWYIGGYKNMF